jgi:hypothetical protein
VFKDLEGKIDFPEPPKCNITAQHHLCSFFVQQQTMYLPFLAFYYIVSSISAFRVSHHWIMKAVNATKGSKLNPLYSILDHFDEDDLIIIKLDVDHSDTEMPLVLQLLEDEKFHSMVDHFYFEHHVFLGEMANWWTRSMKGSMKDSFEIFNSLREKGIVSHFWI